jgi:hypothetical protein
MTATESFTANGLLDSIQSQVLSPGVLEFASNGLLGGSTFDGSLGGTASAMDSQSGLEESKVDDMVVDKGFSMNGLLEPSSCASFHLS